MLNSITVAEFIHEYWFILVGLIAVIAVASVYIYNWLKKPNNEQIEQVKQWLLFAVAKAEKELGSGTGKIKLRYVYDMFVTKFPAAALFISFTDFKIMVEEALEKFEELIQTNPSVGAMYGFQDMSGIDEEEKKDE